MIPILSQIGDLRSHILKLLSQQLDQFVEHCIVFRRQGRGCYTGNELFGRVDLPLISIVTDRRNAGECRHNASHFVEGMAHG